MVKYQRVTPEKVIEEKTEDVHITKMVLNFTLEQVEIKMRHHNNEVIPRRDLSDNELRVFDQALKIAERVLGLSATKE